MYLQRQQVYVGGVFMLDERHCSAATISCIMAKVSPTTFAILVDEESKILYPATTELKILAVTDLWSWPGKYLPSLTEIYSYNILQNLRPEATLGLKTRLLQYNQDALSPASDTAVQQQTLADAPAKDHVVRRQTDLNTRFRKQSVICDIPPNEYLFLARFVLR